MFDWMLPEKHAMSPLLIATPYSRTPSKRTGSEILVHPLASARFPFLCGVAIRDRD